MPPLSLKGRIARDEHLIAGDRSTIARLQRDLRHRQAVLSQREARLHAERHLRNAQARAAHPSGAAAGVAWGLKQVGVHEQPAFSNAGPGISEWIRAGGGQPGWSWCQYFAAAVLVRGGGPQLLSGYTVAVVQWARQHQHGLSIVAASNMAVGDFLYYKWPGVSKDFCDHVGVYAGGGRSLEGNTSPGSSGSQNNGGGVYLHTLAERRPYLVAVVRPTYR